MSVSSLWTRRTIDSNEDPGREHPVRTHDQRDRDVFAQHNGSAGIHRCPGFRLDVFDQHRGIAGLHEQMVVWMNRGLVLRLCHHNALPTHELAWYLDGRVRQQHHVSGVASHYRVDRDVYLEVRLSTGNTRKGKRQYEHPCQPRRPAHHDTARSCRWLSIDRSTSQ
jgi:hypothetical protein